MNQKIHKSVNAKGFTLIETAISLTILGLIFAFLIPLYNQYHRERVETKTETNLEAARIALENFKAEYGRFPCPASLSANRTSGSYGHEVNDCVTGPTSIAVGSCDAGKNYCVQESPRTTLTPAQRRVLVGALPFRMLQLPERQTYDGWDSKIVYTVTESTTSISTYNDGLGGIRLTDENGEIIGNSAYQDSYKFLVFSLGKNRVGGYTMDGMNPVACNTGYNAMDKANCDFLANVNMASFAIANQSTGQNNSYFDDRVVYTNADITGNSEGWRFGQKDLGENTSDIIVEGRNVRIGSFDAPLDPLSITGNIKLADTSGGKISADQFCNSGDCFDVTGLNYACPPNEYVVGISAGLPHIKCSPVYFGCDEAGKILAGKNIDGSPKCVTTTAPPSTPPTPVPGPGPVDDPLCVGSSSTASYPCPSDPTRTYQETKTISCPFGNIVTTNDMAAKCCGLTQQGKYDCGAGANPRYHYFTQNRLNCSAAWVPTTHPNPLPVCTCNADVVSNPEPPCASDPDKVGNKCIKRTTSYVLGSGKCTAVNNDIPGSCNPATFRWKGSDYTGSNNTSNAPSIPDEGSACSYGDKTRTCERTSGGLYQVWDCACTKVLEPCTPQP